MPSPSILDRGLTLMRIDLGTRPAYRQPVLAKMAIATVVTIIGSLAADAALVAIGTHAFASTKGYVHFQFHDYAKLTIVGVIIACVAWPLVVRISSAPRWLFFRLAIVVTLVLLLPDLYILHQGQPFKAVAFLMLMHLAIGVITYNALVRLAPVRRRHVNRWHPPIESATTQAEESA
jgi:hypothetical protein